MPLGEDAREWKDGGGDAGGHCWAASDATGEWSSSWAATCVRLSVRRLDALRKGSRGHMSDRTDLGNVPSRSLGWASCASGTEQRGCRDVVENSAQTRTQRRAQCRAADGVQVVWWCRQAGAGAALRMALSQAAGAQALWGIWLGAVAQRTFPHGCSADPGEPAEPKHHRLLGRQPRLRRHPRRLRSHPPTTMAATVSPRSPSSSCI